jgi:plasmid stabilization system protein ParE
MDNGTIKTVYKEKAATSIYNIGFYIEAKGYPVTANKFISELFDFGDSLQTFPDKYPICRKKVWANRKLRCAVFKKNYIFIYKLIGDELVIFNVVHSKTITLK